MTSNISAVSSFVEKESYLLELSVYIHLTPVRAGVVEYPEEYRWSSYRTYIGEGEEGWRCQDWVLGSFSPAKEKERKVYREFMVGVFGEESCGSVRRGLCRGHSFGVNQGASRIEERRRQGVQWDNELRSLESRLRRDLKCQV